MVAESVAMGGGRRRGFTNNGGPAGARWARHIDELIEDAREYNDFNMQVDEEMATYVRRRDDGARQCRCRDIQCDRCGRCVLWAQERKGKKEVSWTET